MGYSFKWILEHLSQSLSIGTASYALNAGTASFVTASSVWGPNGSSSVNFALTASYALNASGSPQGPANSIQFYSGSTFGGSSNFIFLTQSNSVELTGSMLVNGAISASSGANTVGFYGTSSWALSASNAISSSYATSASWVGLLAGPNITINYNPSGIAITASVLELPGTDIWRRSIGSQSAVLIAPNPSFAGGTGSVAFGVLTSASGDYSLAHGGLTVALGTGSHAEGRLTTSYGNYSHAEGSASIAYGTASHAEGYVTIANGTYSHAEGENTQAAGLASHAEGRATSASGDWSHAEGLSTTAIGYYSHAEGYETRALGSYSHAEGQGTSTNVYGFLSYDPGSSTPGVIVLESAYGDVTSAFMNSRYIILDDIYAFSVLGGLYRLLSYTWDGTNTILTLVDSTVSLVAATIVPVDPLAPPTTADQLMYSGYSNHAEGLQSRAMGTYTHAEGEGTIAMGRGSHAEGIITLAAGNDSHTEGSATIAYGEVSHAEGYVTTTYGLASHAEGSETNAVGEASHAEGWKTITSGAFSHSEGLMTLTLGPGSHAEGSSSIAFGTASHASGLHTIASGSFQTTLGQYNLHNNTSSLFVIGDGASDGNRRDLLRADIGVVRITGSLIVSNSFQLIGIGTVTGSFIVSNSLNTIGTSFVTGSNLITGSWQLIGPGTVTGSLLVSRSLTTIGTSIVTGSNLITGSWQLIGSGSVTGSLIVSNSFTVIGTNTTTGSAFVTGSIYLTGSQYFSKGVADVALPGQLAWSDGSSTLDLGLSGSAVGNERVLSIGQQQIARVYNAEATPITKGQVVYVSGSQGNRIAVKLAAATAELGSANTIGLVLDDTIAAGAEGYVITEGPLYKIDTNAYSGGVLLYLSTTPGAFTSTAPTAPNHRVTLGFVERIGGATQGSIYVKVDNGYELDELHNVKISAPSSSGDLLVLSGSVWINSKQLTGTYGITGSLSATEAISAPSFTGSLLGTASYVTGSIFTGTNQAVSASYATHASSAFYAQTASYLLGGTSSLRIYNGNSSNAEYSNISNIYVTGSGVTMTNPSTGIVTMSIAGGSATPGGSINQIQYNVDNVVLGGVPTLTYSGSVLRATGSFSGSLDGIATTASFVSGSVFTSGNPALTASHAITASLALTALPSAPINSIQYNSGSRFVGSSTFTFISSSNTLYLTGSAVISGSVTASKMLISSSGNQQLIVAGSGSSNPIFATYGSQGSLVSITDSPTGSLLTVNDISGFTTLKVLSDYTTQIGDPYALTLHTSKVFNIVSVGPFKAFTYPTSSTDGSVTYNGMFIEYTAVSSSNARAGSMMAIRSGSSVNYTETTTTDFGNTSGLNLLVAVSASVFVLSGSASTANWTLKSNIRII